MLKIHKVAQRFAIKLAETVACGNCYPFAYRFIADSEWDTDVTLVHGTVSEPFTDPPHEYLHAWIEKEGVVYDWQTMEASHGGQYSGKGYPKSVFYELFDPKNMTKFDKEQALINLARNGHYGPW